MRRITLLATANLLLTACSSIMPLETVPAEDAGLTLSLEATPRSIAPGDTVLLVARLRNTNSEPVTLRFPSGCQILPHVENAAGQLVEPQGGGWACRAVLTELALAPGETAEYVFHWTGQLTSYSPAWQPVHEPLPGGEYRAYAILVEADAGNRRVALRTPSIAITLR